MQESLGHVCRRNEYIKGMVNSRIRTTLQGMRLQEHGLFCAVTA